MSAAGAFAAQADRVAGWLGGRPLLRAINFHNTARQSAAMIERQIALCARRFDAVTEDDLDRYLANGTWHKPRPGMILAFYEGYRNGYDVVLPLLERHGLVGWFFVITGFVDAPVPQQMQYAMDHDIGMSTREYTDGRYALSWDEIRELDRHHVIASHARSHADIAAMDAAGREAEVVGSQRRFEAELGHPVRSFVSYGGPAHGEFSPADRLVDAAGYQFQFSNHRIQRLR